LHEPGCRQLQPERHRRLRQLCRVLAAASAAAALPAAQAAAAAVAAAAISSATVTFTPTPITFRTSRTSAIPTEERCYGHGHACGGRQRV